MPRFRAAFLALLLCALAASCGKKAPPRLPVYETLPPPEALEALQRYSPRQVVLTWRPVKDAASYVVLRSLGGKPPETVVEVDGTRFDDASLPETGVVGYQVGAKSARGLLGTLAEPVAVVPVAEFPEPPGVQRDVLRDSVRISWDGAAGALYNLYRRSPGAPLPLAPLNRSPLADGTYEVAPEPDVERFYFVRQVLGQWTEGPASAEVRVGPESFVPEPPFGLQFARTEEAALLLFWEESPEAWVRGYRVYRLAGQGEYELLGEPRTPAFEDREAPQGALSYRVTAVGPLVESEPSEPLPVPPLP